MMIRSNAPRSYSQLSAIVLAVVVIASLYFAKAVILPLALALLFTFILAPVVSLLEHIRFPRSIAVVIVLASAGAILGIIGWTVVRQLIQITADLPSYTLNIQKKAQALRDSKSASIARVQGELDWLGKQIGILNSDVVKNQFYLDAETLGSSPDRPISVKEVGSSHGRVDTISGVLGVLVSTLLVTVFTFFMLLKRDDLRDRMMQLGGQGQLNLMTQAMDDTSRRVSRYLSLQLLMNAAYCLMIFLALQLIGLPHALLWGALAGLLRFIPYIGAPIAALLPIALSLAVFDGWTKTLLIMAIFAGTELITANLLEPHVYGKYTGLSSLAVLIAAIFWALIWGPIGLILSVPLTVCLAVMGTHIRGLEFLTVLLGDQPVMSPEARYYQRLLSNNPRDAGRVLESCLKDTSLRGLFDAVLVPALQLAEEDRHQNALDESTVSFITQTTKDLVEDLALRKEESLTTDANVQADDDAKSPLAIDGAGTSDHVVPQRIVCVPVRDDADEIVGIMLAKLLEREGYSTIAVPIGSVDAMLADVFNAKPDIVCLSALPPYAVAHARSIYKRLRQQNPRLTIIIGLWNCLDDSAKAAREISGGELGQLCTSLTQITLQAKLALQTP
jgi:predicted PurR-regulated permease PerM